MRIYTKTGDGGETGLFDGTRVSKADPRVEAYGDVDELNAWLGLVRSNGPGADVDALLAEIQRDLFALGAVLADPRHKIASRVEKAAIGNEDVTRLEAAIDAFENGVPALRRFILPAAARPARWLHLARTVCRRAERRMIAIGATAGADPCRCDRDHLHQSPVRSAVRPCARGQSSGRVAETEW
jgi:cob(I)alamin adenosyltransferase